MQVKFSLIGVKQDRTGGSGDKNIYPAFLGANVGPEWNEELFPKMFETCKRIKTANLRPTGNTIIGYSSAVYDGNGIKAQNVLFHGFGFIDLDGKDNKKKDLMDINHLRDAAIGIGLKDFLVYFSASGKGNHLIFPYARQMKSQDHVCAQAEVIEKLEARGYVCDRSCLDIARKIFACDKTLQNYRFYASGKGYERRTVGDEILTTIKADLTKTTLQHYKSNSNKAIDDAVTKKVNKFLTALEEKGLIGGFYLDDTNTWFNIHSANWEAAATPMNNFYGASDGLMWKKRSGEYIGNSVKEFYEYLNARRG